MINLLNQSMFQFPISLIKTFMIIFFEMNKNTRILVTSDTHNEFSIQDYQMQPQADVFIHCGDFTQDSSAEELQQFRELLQQMKEIVKIVIPGNHQKLFYKQTQKNHPEYAEIEQQRKQFSKVCHFLEYDLIQVKGISILGIAKGPQYFDWNFDFMPQQGAPIIQKFRGNVDILVTHWPPYGILDTINKKQKGGSKGLLNFVNLIKPKVHLFGHIHQGYGFVEIDNIKFYNASFMDKEYNPKNKPFLIQFPSKISQIKE